MPGLPSLPFLICLFLHWVGEAFRRLVVPFPVESCRLVALPSIGDSPVLRLKGVPMALLSLLTGAPCCPSMHLASLALTVTSLLRPRSVIYSPEDKQQPQTPSSSCLCPEHLPTWSFPPPPHPPPAPFSRAGQIPLLPEAFYDRPTRGDIFP